MILLRALANPYRVGLEPRAPVAVLVAAFLFNLGQGVLRPSLPLYLYQSFAANYTMVTLIPMVFGAGKWIASLPTGFWLDRLGRRRLMIAGLLVIALSDAACMMPLGYGVFLSLRALAGTGWAMFGTVATTILVDHPRIVRRGRAISLFLMSETLGLLLGSAAGGWLYQNAGVTSPFAFEAGCMLVAGVAVARGDVPTPRDSAERPAVAGGWRMFGNVLRVPGVILMGVTSTVLIAVQTGILVFLYPLYLIEQGRLRPEIVGYFVSLSVVGRLAGLWLGGSGADRWGRMPVLVPGLLAYSAFIGGLTMVTHPLVLGVWSLMIGVAGGVVAGLPTAIVGDTVAPPLKGVAIGWLRTATDTGMLLGPPLLGALADAVQLSSPFLLAAALLGLVACRCWSARRSVEAAGGRSQEGPG